MTTVRGITLSPGRTGWERRPGLIAIDVDHTLIRSDHTLAQPTVDAVRRIRRAGVEVVLASSRPPGGMRQFLDALGLIDPAVFVAFQGTFVGSFDAEGVLTAHATSPLAREVALAAARAARSVGLGTNWYTADGWFVDRITEAVKHEAHLVRMEPQLVTDLETLPTPLKLLFIAERSGQIDAVRPLLPDSVTAETSNPRYLEITATGVDKATGVRVAAARSGIDMADVVAIGDGRNDLGLFRRVGGSIAPANADPAVLAEADYLTASNDDDGVAMALDWLAELPT